MFRQRDKQGQTLCHENTGTASKPMWIEKNELEKDVGDEVKETGRGQIMQSF